MKPVSRQAATHARLGLAGWKKLVRDSQLGRMSVSELRTRRELSRTAARQLRKPVFAKRRSGFLERKPPSEMTTRKRGSCRQFKLAAEAHA